MTVSYKEFNCLKFFGYYEHEPFLTFAEKKRKES